jgi:hypothetical protein
VSVGLLLCSHVIEGSTTEFEFVPNPESGARVQVIALQQKNDVGEQQFSPYVTVCKPNEASMRASILNTRDYKYVLLLFLGS